MQDQASAGIQEGEAKDKLARKVKLEASKKRWSKVGKATIELAQRRHEQQSRSRRESRSGQNLTAESQKLIAWLHRADRSGPSGDLETKPAGSTAGS